MAGIALKPFIPWVGGKTALRPILYELFPGEYTRFVEVFGGGAAVLFGREPGRCVEIYNDRNSDLVNLFLCVKHQLWACSRRLANVVIENQSYEDAIPKYDAPGTLLYLDPPYYEAECYQVSFELRDHYRLRELVGECRGYAALSYNDCPFIRELYRDFWMFSASRPNSMANRYQSGSEYAELIILNYDPRAHSGNQQMTLSDTLGEAESREYEYTLVHEGRLPCQ